MTLVVSAISLKCHDNNKLDLAMRVNREGSRIVVVLYVVANLVAIGLALR